MIKNILPEGVECIFVRQPEQLGLGHAVLCAERVVGNEAFAVILADDFLISRDLGATNDLVLSYNESGKNQISVMEVNGPKISEYGVLIPGNDLDQVQGLVEKPLETEAPSNLASIGRYILTGDIFDILRKMQPGSGGEIQLADAINILAKSGNVSAKRFEGLRFDCGSVTGYLDAILHVSNDMVEK